MNLRHALPAAALALGLLLAPAASHAQGLLDMTFTHPTLMVVDGGTVTFTGSIANNSGGTIFLTGDSYTPFPAGITLDDSPFFFGAPPSLADGTAYPASGSAALFTMTAAPTLKAGLYSGYFNVLGGPVKGEQFVEATQKFNFQVVPGLQAVPEPSSLASLGLLTLGVGLLAFRASRRRSAA